MLIAGRHVNICSSQIVLHLPSWVSKSTLHAINLVFLIFLYCKYFKAKKKQINEYLAEIVVPLTGSDDPMLE